CCAATTQIDAGCSAAISLGPYDASRDAACEPVNPDTTSDPAAATPSSAASAYGGVSTPGDCPTMLFSVTGGLPSAPCLVLDAPRQCFASKAPEKASSGLGCGDLASWSSSSRTCLSTSWGTK